MQAPLHRKVSSAELSQQREEEKVRFKQAAERVQKELEKYCPSVQYAVHGTYCWKSMISEAAEVAQ